MQSYSESELKSKSKTVEPELEDLVSWEELMVKIDDPDFYNRDLQINPEWPMEVTTGAYATGGGLQYYARYWNFPIDYAGKLVPTPSTPTPLEESITGAKPFVSTAASMAKFISNPIKNIALTGEESDTVRDATTRTISAQPEGSRGHKYPLPKLWQRKGYLRKTFPMPSKNPYQMAEESMAMDALAQLREMRSLDPMNHLSEKDRKKRRILEKRVDEVFFRIDGKNPVLQRNLTDLQNLSEQYKNTLINNPGEEIPLDEICRKRFKVAQRTMVAQDRMAARVNSIMCFDNTLKVPALFEVIPKKRNIRDIVPHFKMEPQLEIPQQPEMKSQPLRRPGTSVTLTKRSKSPCPETITIYEEEEDKHPLLRKKLSKSNFERVIRSTELTTRRGGLFPSSTTIMMDTSIPTMDGPFNLINAVDSLDTFNPFKAAVEESFQPEDFGAETCDSLLVDMIEKQREERAMQAAKKAVISVVGNRMMQLLKGAAARKEDEAKRPKFSPSKNATTRMIDPPKAITFEPANIEEIVSPPNREFDIHTHRITPSVTEMLASPSFYERRRKLEAEDEQEERNAKRFVAWKKELIRTGVLKAPGQSHFKTPPKKLIPMRRTIDSHGTITIRPNIDTIRKATLKEPLKVKPSKLVRKVATPKEPLKVKPLKLVRTVVIPEENLRKCRGGRDCFHRNPDHHDAQLKREAEREEKRKLEGKSGKQYTFNLV